MPTIPLFFVLLAVVAAPQQSPPPPTAHSQQALANPQIDYAKFLKVAKQVQPYRERRRVTEQQFLKLAAEKGTLILDTRSERAFNEVHLKGAVHLNFSDITSKSLAKTLGDKNTRVLIYCNNNFRTEEPALAMKAATAALNIPTFVTLYAYGYKNLYELGPVVDPKTSRLRLEGSAIKAAGKAGLPSVK